MSALKAESERNRSVRAERPVTARAVPQNAEGRDGDHKFVVLNGVTWSYWRVNGRWKRVRLEDA